jgi:hypothetical protein
VGTRRCSVWYLEERHLHINVHYVIQYCRGSSPHMSLRYGVPLFSVSLRNHSKQRKTKLLDKNRCNWHSHTHIKSKLSYILIDHSFTDMCARHPNRSRIKGVIALTMLPWRTDRRTQPKTNYIGYWRFLKGDLYQETCHWP